MKHLFKTLLGAAILFAAWVWTFGAPWQTGDAGLEALGAAPSVRAGPAAIRRGTGAPASAEIALSSYSEVLTAIGTSRARNSLTVTAEAAGLVAWADLTPHREVAAGDVLLRLTDDLEQIEATTRQAQLAAERRTLERYLTLSRSNSGAVAQNTVQDAEIAVALAEAAAERAQHELERRTIRAPIGGRLSLTDIRAGTRIAAGTEIVTIDDTSSILVSFVLPERAVGLLETGREIRATTPALAGRSFTATISAFDSRIDPVTRTVAVEAEIMNPDGRLWPGMSFSVHIERESPPLPHIPASALTWTREGARIWIVRDGRAMTLPVLVRMRQEDSIWVEAEVLAGDRVVIDGNARLTEGAPVGADRPAADEGAAGAGIRPRFGAGEGGQGTPLRAAGGPDPASADAAAVSAASDATVVPATADAALVPADSDAETLENPHRPAPPIGGDRG